MGLLGMSVHGTARFATRWELQRADLLRSLRPEELPDGLMVGWWYEDSYDFAPISYQGDLHQLIVGGIGGGKFTTAIAPLLLGSGLEDSTVVVVDPKGEIAKLAGTFFQKPFADTPDVFLLDPWDVCGTGTTASLNVLDDITPENPNYVDDARALADAMIIPSGADNTHWDNAARNFLTGVILYVALSPKEKDNRDLKHVRDIITLSWKLPDAYPNPPPTLSGILFANLNSDLADGEVGSAFRSLINREEKERSGIISSIERDTAWIGSPQMVRVLRGSSIDLKEAAIGGGKYFIALPPDYFMTHRAWLRLMVTAFSKAMKRHQPDKSRPQHQRWRHIVIDEFATLGEMSFILNDVAIGRGFDVKYHLAVQDLAQLRRVYREGWESFINNSFQRFFAVGDLFTADYVSRMLGAATVASESTSASQSRTQGHSFGTSTGSSDGFSTPPGIIRFSTHTGGTSETRTSGYSESTSQSTSRTIGQVQRALRTPDEVRRLKGDEQLLFMRGMHPIDCWRPPYWEIFPSLPTFSLKEILGTVGREPKDEAERAYFTAWRAEPLLMRPPERPPVSTPAPVLTLPAPPVPPLEWRLAAATIAFILVIVLSWFGSGSTPSW
jgi:type IV secretion system protein VirD4